MAMENKDQEQNPKSQGEETNTVFFELGFMLLVSLITIVVYSYALMFAWNDFAVALFGAKEMSFTNALALLVLRHIAFGQLQNSNQTLFKKNSSKKE